MTGLVVKADRPDHVAVSKVKVATARSPKDRTLYVRAEDLRVWERAEELAGQQSLSNLITDLLRDWVEARGVGRVVVEVDDVHGSGRHRQAFQGRRLTTVPGPAGIEWTVYQTARGQLALYDGRALLPYRDLQHLRANVRHHEILANVQEALKREHVEELDI